MNLNQNTARIRVEGARVAMALPFRAYHDPRHALAGICIQPSKEGGANILATNGFVLACIRDLGGRCDRPAILPIGKSQLTHLRKGGHLLVNEDGLIWIADESGVPLWISPQPEVVAKFPDVSPLVGPVEEYREGLVGMFNPDLLDTIRRCLPRGKYKGVRFYHREGLHTAPTLCSLGGYGFAAVMGMRYDESQGALSESIPADFVKAA